MTEHEMLQQIRKLNEQLEKNKEELEKGIWKREIKEELSKAYSVTTGGSGQVCNCCNGSGRQN